MKIVTSLRTLMQAAKAVGDAKKSGDPVAIQQAEDQLKSYEQLVLKSDHMLTGLTTGDLL